MTCDACADSRASVAVTPPGEARLDWQILLDIADRLGDDAAVDVVAKTMRKMSADGLGAAAALDLDERGRSLLDRAALLHAGSG